MKRLALGGAAAAALLGLVACATEPMAVAPPRPDPRLAQRQQVFDAAVAHAADAERHDRWREALWRWRVAEAVESVRGATAPDIARVEAHISAVAASDVQRASAALARGDVVEARDAYEAALEIDPGEAEARRALREIDGREMLVRIAESGAGGPGPRRPFARRRTPVRFPAKGVRPAGVAAAKTAQAPVQTKSAAPQVAQTKPVLAKSAQAKPVQTKVAQIKPGQPARPNASRTTPPPR